MARHAQVVFGETEAGISSALAFGERALNLSGTNPDITILRYGLFSVDDARAVVDLASRAPLTGDAKLIIISASRMFHEAQNALLKLFEEPPGGTHLVLVIPSDGMLLETLRSRLIELSSEKGMQKKEEGIASEFMAADASVREKIIAKLLDRAKSDKPEEKQRARADALLLAEGLMCAAYVARKKNQSDTELAAFVSDLDRFIPILHERSAPLKLIFEHLLLVLPKMLTNRA